MSNLQNDVALERLWDLYYAECDRDKTKPNIRDFNVWISEKGYDEDMSGLYD